MPFYAYAATAAVLLLVAGCGDDGDDPKVDCAAANEKAVEMLIKTAEGAIWDYKLYKSDKKIPPELLRNGEPVPFDQMTQLQQDLFFGWTNDNPAYELGAQEKLNDLRDEAQETDFTGQCRR